MMDNMNNMLNDMNQMSSTMSNMMSNMNLNMNENNLIMSQMNPMRSNPMMNSFQVNNQISVIFLNYDNKEKTTILCNKNDKIKDIIQMYRNKSSDNNQLKHFLFNGKRLNQSLTVDESSLADGCEIEVVNIL